MFEEHKISYLEKYVLKYGVFDFTEYKFNIIDALIFSILSYFRFDFLNESKQLTLYETVKIYFRNKYLYKLSEVNPCRNPLLKKIYRSKRYKDLILFNYCNDLNPNLDKQFGAISIILNDETVFVSFRGTDSSLTGLKEDFNMSYCKTISSQKSAKNYLKNKIYKKFKIINIGGHSKGGNLALYSSIYSSNVIKNKIKYIFNFDGPGFQDEIINTKKYELISHKVISVMPQMSIIGMIFNKPQNVYVIKSDSFLLGEHNPFSWVIEKDNFKYIDMISKSSEIFNNSVKDYFNELTFKQRRKFVIIVWGLYLKVIAELKLNNEKRTNYKLLKYGYKEYKNLSKEKQEFIKKCFKTIIKILLKNRKTKKENRKIIIKKIKL